MNSDESKKVNETTSKDEKAEAPTVEQKEEPEDVIVAAEMKKGRGMSAKNFFGYILRIIGGIILGTICAVIGTLLAIFLVGICLAIGIFITTIYGFLMGIVAVVGALLTTIYGGLIGIIVLLAVLVVIVCIGGGFFLGFSLIVKPELTKESLKEIFK